jgi:hypothetical protein
MTATKSVSRLWPQNALRPPDWRWQQALAIVDGDADTSTIPTPDSSVLAAVEFLVNGPQGSEAAEPTHNIYRAHAIWEADGWDRCLLDSRLLSGSSAEDAARLFQLTEDVVMAYQDLFLDVADRLRYRSFVVHAAICAPRDGVPTKLESAVKSFAYFGGPLVLDAVIAAHANVIESDGLVDAALAMEIDAALAKSVRTAVQTWITPVTVDNVEEWLGLYIDQLAAELVGGRKRSLRNVDAALRRMNRSGRPEKDTDSSPDKREEAGFQGVASKER